ncbi:tyrosine-type recombinase/integrase [Nocardioides sp.]|uniref:tyrosine-type recombinase/integrase n=1 Tax=Nocardioides sp. TaxID=35761 RepID=UPI0039C95A3D
MCWPRPGSRSSRDARQLQQTGRPRDGHQEAFLGSHKSRAGRELSSALVRGLDLAGSGLRVGELLGLQVSDVDFLRREIRVERQRDQAGRIQPVKSKTSRQVVPVGQVVIDALAAHLAAYPSDGAIVVDELAEPMRYRRWRSLMEAAAASIDVDITSHDLRHFYASALIRRRRLGQAGPAPTRARHRGHHAEHLRAPVARRRRPDTGCHRRSPEPTCGLSADSGGLRWMNMQVRGLAP